MKVLIVIVVSLFLSSLAQNPGINFNLRQQLIDGFKESLVSHLITHCKGISLPNFHYKRVTFHNLVIKSPQLSSDKVELNLEDGYVHFAIKDFELSLSGYAKIDLWFIHFNSTFNLYATENVISADITPVVGKHIHFKVANVTAHVGNIHFESEGLLGLIESWMVEVLSVDLTTVINNELETVLEAGLNKYLAETTLPSILEFSLAGDEKKKNESILAFNYSFVNPPAIRTGYLYGDLNGSFYINNNPNGRIPFSNNINLPQIDSKDPNGIQFFLSQYVVSTAVFALQVEGLLQVNITDSKLPGNSTVHMNTNDLNFIFPGLTKKFGSNQPCYMFCWADNSTYPKIGFYEGGAGVNLTHLCSLYALSATTQQWGLAVTYKSTLIAQANVFINSTANTIQLSINNLALTSTSIVVSNIGFLQGAILQMEMNIVLTGFKSIFNTVLKNRGIPLPQIPNSEINSTLALHNGYAEVTVVVNFANNQQVNEWESEEFDQIVLLNWINFHFKNLVNYRKIAKRRKY